MPDIKVTYFSLLSTDPTEAGLALNAVRQSGIIPGCADDVRAIIANLNSPDANVREIAKDCLKSLPGKPTEIFLIRLLNGSGYPAQAALEVLKHFQETGVLSDRGEQALRERVTVFTGTIQ